VFLGEAEVTYPAVVLLVSGGHTLLASALGRGDYELLGTTRDDSAGEAFDKVARMMGLPFPGGPEVDMAAARGTASFALPRPMIKQGLEFSFSGLKTAVAKLMREEKGRHEDVAATFVEAVSDVLETKAMRAVKQVRARSLIVVGGVSASRPIRKRLLDACNSAGVELVLPSMRWATDNGAMIALAAFDYLDAGKNPGTQPISRIPLTEW
jgi:N6-L-threonylcarbamoyladenine synthase